METVNIVDAALAGDKESFMAAFNAALADKVNDALEVKKVELASSLIVPQEQPVEIKHETEGSTTELATDGSNSETE